MKIEIVDAEKGVVGSANQGWEHTLRQIAKAIAVTTVAAAGYFGLQWLSRWFGSLAESNDRSLILPDDLPLQTNGLLTVVNPIPDQAVTIGSVFDLSINITSVFGESVTLKSIKQSNGDPLPAWLNFPSPIQVGTIDTRGQANSVFVLENYAYVTDYDHGLIVVDVSDPANIVQVGSLRTKYCIYNDIYVVGNYAYVAGSGELSDGYSDGLLVIDVSDPANPVQVAAVDYGLNWDAAYVFVTNNFAYLVGGDNNLLEVIDVSDPTNPAQCGTTNTNATTGVFIVSNYAYVSIESDENDKTKGLRVVDISDPYEPYQVGSIDTDDAFSVFVAGNYAYLGCSDKGLAVIDISDPYNPARIGTIDMEAAGDLYIVDDYAYVTTCAGLEIIDINNSSNPMRVGAFITDDSSSSVFVLGNYAYVTVRNVHEIIRTTSFQ